jgi:dipeptidyl aminopeptidase/acylaminoacyl peptidase
MRTLHGMSTNADLRTPGPETLREQVVLEEQDLAPDGSFAVVTRRCVDGNDYVSHLWLVPLDGGESRQLTFGRQRDMRPRVSPDGARIAFTRSLPKDRHHHAEHVRRHTRLLVLDLRGGEPVEPSLGDLDVGEIAWSPDGTRLAFTAEAGAQRFAVGEMPKEDEPLARRITVLDYRYDYAGYLDQRAQVHVVDPVEGATPRRVTDVRGGVSEIAWRPDGAAIAFTADPRPDADLRPATSVWQVEVPAPDAADDVPASEAREILALAGWVKSPAWSPDGRHIAGVGVDDPDFFDDISPSIAVASLEAGPRGALLAPDLDRAVGDWSDGDLTGWQADARPGPSWDGSAVVALVTDRGRVHPWRFPVDPSSGAAAGDPERIGADPLVRAHTIALGGGRMTVTAQVGARPPDLFEVLPDGTLRRLTTMGSTWIDDLEWPGMRVVEAPGPGGPIETWIASPAGAGDEPLPTVVDVHGGPLGAWSPGPSLEVVLLCARGYRVVLPNIRGSCSYGAEWIAPQLGEWGGPDADDVHAALDHVIAMGLADPDRLGALGLSYGGFMVNWLVGTTDRFGAAVSENGVTNQVSAWAHSDTGQEYCRAARMGDPTTPEGIDQLWRQSPLRNVADVRTPLLMLQSEADHRCPPADNEQYFAALRWLRREVEYVVYPEEYHGIQATGRIDRRIDRMTRMLDWFDRFVKA